MTDPLDTIAVLLSDQKGILAADESKSTIEGRFREFGIEATEENRRRYRQMLLTAPEIEKYISGVILFDETIRQRTDEGQSFVELLVAHGIVPGIKVDKGTNPLPAANGERVTEGLDGLQERLEEYRSLGARFAKWRAVISVGAHQPSAYAIDVNAHALARYAAICQTVGLVPIVEPEVVMDGDHSIQATSDATEATLHSVFRALRDQRVVIENILLKPNMVLPGTSSGQKPTADEVAEATRTCFRRAVPAVVPGIVFLSGGQNPQQATENLNAMNRDSDREPWPLSFSFARALQAPALAAWKGDPANVTAGQVEFLNRARCNSLARGGRYTPADEASGPHQRV